MKVRLLVASMFALACAWSGPARAEGDGVLVYGSAAKERGAVVAAAIAEGVRKLAWAPRDVPFTSEETEKLKACLALSKPWNCVTSILTGRGLSRLVAVEVSREPTQLVLTAEFVFGDAVAVSVRRYCKDCKNDVALVETVDAIVTGAAERLPKSAKPVPTTTTAFDVTSVPTGATITVDAESSGTTDRIVAVAAGVHSVKLEKLGFEPVSRTVAAESGKTIPIAVTLRPIEHAGHPVPGDHPSKLLPITLICVGAVAILGGALAYATDEDQPPRGVDHAPTYRDTAPLGVGLMVGGLVVAGIGTFLLVHHPGSNHQTSTPVVFGDHHGGGVGWVAHF